ncbi:DUF2147 domain-containing protein [Sediminispirochaeta bajacaliforniensis]|uniref:hypothetical protein n=1 Tax=Sediminispirochaeta bajacaliforniensis TaxID=148 RepID=UPI00036B1D7C|nr:hypothetical protein [Sediminispirochaeta bajacaliforniensis]
MKKVCFFFTMVFFLSSFSAAAHADPIRSGLGVQLSSDGTAALVLHASNIEAGIKAQAFLYDYASETASYPNLLVVGMHVAYLFSSAQADSEFGIGIEAHTGIGLEDLEYDEYIDLGLRLSINQPISRRLYISGILYPFFMETRDESDVDDDWEMTVTLPKASVAFTLIF